MVLINAPLLVGMAVASALSVIDNHRGHHLISTQRPSRQSSSVLASGLSGNDEVVRAGGAAHLFLRFSPLIGGPAILPLHVEVIVAVDEKHQIQQKIMDSVCFRRNNNLSSTPFLQQEHLQLHRFDFLPKDPTNPSTLARLITLQGVPGRLRYRIYERNNGDTNKQNNVEATTNQDGKGIAILVPIGSLCIDDEKDSYSANTVVSTAIEFRDKYRDTVYRELKILGGKNCLSYALDLLSHVDDTIGIQKTARLNKFDIE